MNIKKALFALIILVSFVSLLSAQSLYDNEYYYKSVEYKKLADTSYGEGQYDQAYEYALESEKYAKMSDDYIAEKKLMYQANSKLKQAERRFAYAEKINLNDFNQPLYQEASDSLDSARSLYELKSYDDSIIQSDKVIELLALISPEPGEVKPINDATLLPKFYTVRLIQDRRDCFWRIAEYDFVYADGTKWKLLYDQNKAQFLDSQNPDLIYPGQVFEIPSSKGEERKGIYNPEIDYPSINE